MKFLLSFSILALFACGKDKAFKGGAQSKNIPKAAEQTPKTIEPVIGEPVVAPNALSYTFKRNGKASPIDMIWVIDNSGSMDNEAAQVRKNFKKFTAEISLHTDLSLSLVSSKSTFLGTEVEMDEESIAAGHVQIDQQVESTDAFIITSSLLCPEGSADLCSNFAHYIKYESALAPRVRPEAQRVYVYVSDDDINGAVNADNFMDLTGSNPERTRLFAFAGIGTSTCGIARRGKTYETLALATKGKVFDICESDWSANFKQLTDSVIEFANQFEIPVAGELKILKVTLAGKALTESQYKIEGKKIQIIDSSLTSSSGDITVEYELKS